MKFKLAVDVQYQQDEALVAGVLFPFWDSDRIHRVLTKTVTGIEPYEPGSFYKRELPCILSLLEDVDEEIEAIVIDGFVVLGSEKKDGLGMYLYNAINQKASVIGVAKKAFLTTPEEYEILRGSSKNPLFVTSAGMPLDDAKKRIIGMHGKNRIPTVLKKVDQICRGISS